MNKTVRILVVVAILIPLLVCTLEAYPAPPAVTWPVPDWTNSLPEAQGMDSQRLAEAFRFIADKELNLHSLLILRNGSLVAEAYFDPYTRDTPHEGACITKSVIGMLTGIAIDHGALSGVDQPVLGFFPNRTVENLDSRKQAIRIEHLLSLTPGLSCKDYLGSDAEMQKSADWVQYTLDLPMIAEPGEHFTYCSPAVHVLSTILQQTTGMTAREYANEHLFRPIGIAPVPPERWSSDPSGISTGIGLQLTPREMARLGYLYLNKGQWNGRQVVSPQWVAASIARHSTWEEEPGRDYGYLFWLFSADGYYSAMGMGGQQIHIVPEKNMVVVVTAGIGARAEDYIRDLMRDYILPAASASRLLPANPQAAERLASAIRQVSASPQHVPPLPELVRRISGQVYQLEPNPLGWKQISLEFGEGQDTARMHVDQTMATVGLDNVYRATTAPGNVTFLLKGHWQDEETFLLDAAIQGSPQKLRFRMMFGDGEVNLQMLELVYGGPAVNLHGVAK